MTILDTRSAAALRIVERIKNRVRLERHLLARLGHPLGETPGCREQLLFLCRAALPEHGQVVEHGTMVAMHDLANSAGSKATFRQVSYRHAAGLHEQGIAPPGGEGGGGDAVRLGNAGDGVTGPGDPGRWYGSHRSILSKWTATGHLSSV